MAISMLKIRRPLGRLIFNMGIAIPGKTVFLIETAPRRLIIIINKTQIRVYISAACPLSCRHILEKGTETTMHLSG